MKIRNATIEDMQIYFDWRNDALVRQSAFNTEPVSWEGHQRWFKSRLNDPDSVMYLVTESHQPIGQVRFECNGKCAEINYSLSQEVRGRKKATPLMKLSIETLHRERPNIEQLKAYVKSTNKASIKVFERLQFHFVGFDKEKDANLYLMNYIANTLGE